MKRRHRLSCKLTLAVGILLLVLWAVWGTLHVLDLALDRYYDAGTIGTGLTQALLASEELNEWQPEPATPEEYYDQQYELFLLTQFSSQEEQASIAVATVTDGRPTLGRNFQVSVVARSHVGLYVADQQLGEYGRQSFFVVLDDQDTDTVRQLDQLVGETVDAYLQQGVAQPPLTLEGRRDGFYFYPRQITIGEDTWVLDPEEASEETRTVTPTELFPADDHYVNYRLMPSGLSQDALELYMDSIHRIVDEPDTADNSMILEDLEELGIWSNRPSLSMLRRHVSGGAGMTPTSYEDYGHIFVRTLVQNYPIAKALDAARPNLIITFVVLLLCMAIFWWIFRAKVTEPLEAVTAESKKLARLAFDEFAPDTARKDEIGNLSRALTEVSDQLHQRWDDERDLEKKRQEFVASASHDLKTPLALIGGYAEAIAQGISPEDNARYLDAIEREAGRMNTLVLEMLDYTKLERMEELAGADTLSLAKLVQDLLEEMSPLFAGRKVTANLEKFVRVRGDEALLRRAIGNLLSNAAKFTPEGGEITVTLSTVPNPDPSFLALPLPVLTVENTGEPIAPEDLPRIFEMFYRGDKARDRSGSGLGLAITRRIFALHHLTCRAENLEHGVRFTVAPEEP